MARQRGRGQGSEKPSLLPKASLYISVSITLALSGGYVVTSQTPHKLPS
ncbi:hypothetical protein CKAH01_18792 [Colletotrichum kahawae]|uniref:Uncharacterized protein n=1 Tax=Colletotrichum kahawae TaxID=34407 RepID=A0AAE0D1P9_COLKA|nr:hypothetical protein CKAH01_18792 [Colletotrichum kahawae]